MFRSDFPIFTTHPELIYLDSASTAQKPEHVILAMDQYFRTNLANIHRGAYDLSVESSALYDQAKERLWKHLGGVSLHEIVFTYNATYAANLISHSLVKTGILKKGDVVLISKLEHHANIVPWQIVAEEHNIHIEWIEVQGDGTLDYEDLGRKIPNAKVLALTAASNVTGELVDLARVQSFLVPLMNRPLWVVDGSQRFPHMETDVRKYGIDIFFATGHKSMSDTGIGFFYARKDLLKNMLPAFCWGGAINHVGLQGYEPAWLPFRHEPGTPHVAGAVSLLAALEYIDSIGGFPKIEAYENELIEYALEKLHDAWFIDGRHGVKLLGSFSSEHRLWVFSFVFENIHPHDVSEKLADKWICVRSGHHCTEPLHRALNIPASLRVSLYLYNAKKDIDILIAELNKIIR